MKTKPQTKNAMLFSDFLKEFCQVLKIRFDPAAEFAHDVSNVLFALEGCDLHPPERRRRELIRSLNTKFEFNRERIQAFFTLAASNGITFNYHEKKVVASIFNGGVRSELLAFLHEARSTASQEALGALADSFNPLSQEQSTSALHRELRSPTLVRKDSKPRDWSNEILSSLMSAFLYCCFPAHRLHALNDPLGDGCKYEPDFWNHLHRNVPHLFSRENTLDVLHVSSDRIRSQGSYESLRAEVLEYIRHSHEALSNHGYLAIVIDSAHTPEGALHWKLFADAILYAEKHIQEPTSRYFFRGSDIADATASYIDQLDLRRADFRKVARGFIYQDCFVVGEGDGQRLLLLFQKNVADETLIPCPACRSHVINGNSYSSFGVRSWECQNQFCPERTKFNRGKRYSFMQLLKQRAIQDVQNEIPIASIRKWMRDVQPNRHLRELFEMLLRHYTLKGDGVSVTGIELEGAPSFGRTVSLRPAPPPPSEPLGKYVEGPKAFRESSYFARYLVERSTPKRSISLETESVNGTTAIHGDAFEAISQMTPDSVDAAVTSPPYYNAREYSKWANIYTYLYDMFNVNRLVFRVLKPGGLYLFNIFDYFDNENNVALSAMGNKRMILGAYIVDMFERIGLRCIGNVVWDKGSIEGKRGFNNGNNCSYYQAPFNCWEHIFVFEKPDPMGQVQRKFPTTLKEKPVIKMIGGYNTHGHSAPFPEAIPLLLAPYLPAEAIVLDPFAGSMTTGIAMARANAAAVCIERDREYFKLGVRKLREVSDQGSLALI